MCPFATVCMLDEVIVVKQQFRKGYFSLTLSFEGNSFTQRHEILSQGHTETETLSYNMLKTRSLHLIRIRIGTES